MTPGFEPVYLNLVRSGELQERINKGFQRLEKCDLCAWKCKANRRAGIFGICRTGEQARVSSYHPHPGEEAPLSGWGGSGTIFFSRCNMRCQYCQNHEISQEDSGGLVTTGELAEMMLKLQQAGCHNINLVSPSHVVPQILAAVYLAAQSGLRLPLVYNSGGFDSVETIELLDGVVDIYMPDMKYSSAQTGLHYSKIRDYPQVNQAVVKEMYRQVGDLIINDQGLATHGLIVRHLVLPYDLAGTGEIVSFIVKEISPNTYFNLMDQYHPDFNAAEHPKLKRRTTAAEYQAALRLALEAGLTRLNSGQRYSK